MKTQKLTTAQRAALLPAPRPGQVVDMPLDLWPAYKALHGLEAMDRGQVRTVELANQTRKMSGVVYVRKVTEN